MRIEIRGVIDYGNYQSERMVFDVVCDCNLCKYNLNTNTNHSYSFPAIIGKEGDVIVLYTQQGNDYQIKEKDHTIYYLYWNQNDCIWNKNIYAQLEYKAKINK